ncbi:MAG: NADH-quinone oxidoreductase subunit NuoB [Thermofilaceae archaeon]
MKFISESRAKSPWIFHVNAASCNGCLIELLATLSPRYDAERLGCVLVGSPRHADILVAMGPVTSKTLPVLMRAYRQIPEPKVTVALGSCAVSGGVFMGSHVFEGPVEKVIPVDIYIGGCPPKPEAIMKGLMKAAKKLEGVYR